MNIKIEHANSLPMPTWRWLKLNDTTISYDNIDKLTPLKPQIINSTENISLASQKDIAFADFPHITTGIGSDANNFVVNNASNKNYFTIKANTITQKPLIFIYDLTDNLDLIDDNYIYAQENSQATIIIVYNSPYHNLFGNLVVHYFVVNQYLHLDNFYLHLKQFVEWIYEHFLEQVCRYHQN